MESIGGLLLDDKGKMTVHNLVEDNIDVPRAIGAEIKAAEIPIQRKLDKIEIRTSSISNVKVLEKGAQKIRNLAKQVIGSTRYGENIKTIFQHYNINIDNTDNSAKNSDYHLSISVNGKPSRKNFEVKVHQVATSSVWLSEDFKSPVTPISDSRGSGLHAGNIMIRKSQSDTESEFIPIEIKDSDSLKDIALKINNAQVDVEAFVSKRGNGNYRIEFASRDVGVLNDVANLVGYSDAMPLFSRLFPHHLRREAKDARISVNGEVFQNISSNTIKGEDVGLDGVTLNRLLSKL